MAMRALSHRLFRHLSPPPPPPPPRFISSFALRPSPQALPKFVAPSPSLLQLHHLPLTFPPFPSRPPPFFYGPPSPILPLSVRCFSSSHGGPDSPKEDIPAISKEALEVANNAFSSLRETAVSSLSSIQDATDKVYAVLRDRFELFEYTSDTSTQLMYTSLAAVLAWLVLPRILRRLHVYFEDGSNILWGHREKVPYDTSFWSAMENPSKAFVSIVAFSQLGSLIAPTTITADFLHQIWKGAALISLVWFLHRWKSNVFSRMLANQKLISAERERIDALDKILSMGLLLLGGMSVAETCGIAVQSILTVGGVGGVATAFAARDILGNVLSGFSLQFMKPFSIGDIIKAGSVEGQVVNIGLTATQLLDNDKFPVVVPNSFFSSQVIVNKSRATWRAFSLKVPVQLNDFDKVAQITKEIKTMLSEHPKVTRQSGSPVCYASRVTGSSLEINLQCNLIFQGKEDLLSTEQDIALESLKIVSTAGATFSNPGFN